MTDRLRQMAVQAAETAVSLTRPSYFDSKDRGELPELRRDLLSDTHIIRREAVRKVIAGMTAGGKEDYGELFPEILRCLQSKDVETKRLVYLYLSTYAQDRPDMALLAVNAIVKDTEDKSSPVVRSLALRSMSALRIPNLVDYLDDPLRRALRDESGMVRRTAAICLGKLFVNNRDYFEEMELFAALQALLSDPDPFVASNAVAVYLQNRSKMTGKIDIDSAVIARLSQTMEKAGEWGQLQILTCLHDDCLARLTTDQAVVVLRKSAAFLAHDNPAVTMAACRLITALLLRFPDHLAVYDRRVSASVTSLLVVGDDGDNGAVSVECRYMILRMLIGLVQVIPTAGPQLSSVLINNHREPLIVKRARLQLMAAMADRHNVMAILHELSEYAKDVNIAFVEAVVETLAVLASRFANMDSAIRRVIVKLIVDLGVTGVGHLLKAAVTQLYHIYKQSEDGQMTSALLSCFLLDPYALDTPESRVALVWLAGRCGDGKLAVKVIGHFDIQREPIGVQLQILDSLYNLYSASLMHDNNTESLLEEALQYAITAPSSIVLNNRARLLSQLQKTNTAIMIDGDEGAKTATMVPPWFMDQWTMFSTVYHRQVAPLSVPTVTTHDESQSASDDGPRDYLTDYTP